MLARNELVGPGGDRGLSDSSKMGGGIAAFDLCRPSSSYEYVAVMTTNTQFEVIYSHIPLCKAAETKSALGTQKIKDF